MGVGAACLAMPPSIASACMTGRKDRSFSVTDTTREIFAPSARATSSAFARALTVAPRSASRCGASSSFSVKTRRWMRFAPNPVAASMTLPASWIAASLTCTTLVAV